MFKQSHHHLHFNFPKCASFSYNGEPDVEYLSLYLPQVRDLHLISKFKMKKYNIPFETLKTFRTCQAFSQKELQKISGKVILDGKQKDERFQNITRLNACSVDFRNYSFPIPALRGCIEYANNEYHKCKLEPNHLQAFERIKLKAKNKRGEHTTCTLPQSLPRCKYLEIHYMNTIFPEQLHPNAEVIICHSTIINGKIFERQKYSRLKIFMGKIIIPTDAPQPNLSQHGECTLTHTDFESA